ncbi:DUF2304 domain-containing protein [Microbacterium sp.]|uniref:DUF2304 domain-containing protein n=1 Tax=Microbacterium sp. TaxID=51671 RepID=UPI0028A84CEC|nr:DUF2304 domain-containing protein [Microbacterium sp.]
MSTVTYIFGIVAALLALIAIIELMRRGTLRERHAGWWFVGGVMALVIAVFPQTLGWAAAAVGVVVPVNLVFFVAIALLFLVSLQYGAELTRIEEKLRVLAEESAFHERRIARLESAVGRTASAADDDAPEQEGEGL